MIVVYLLLLPAGDVSALGAESFDAREAAHARLARLGPLAYPCLLAARGDLERAQRARGLLAPARGAAVDALAFLLFHAPSPGCLSAANERVVANWPDALHFALAARAYRWGLLDPSEVITLEGLEGAERAGWVNAVRLRAAGRP